MQEGDNKTAQTQQGQDHGNGGDGQRQREEVLNVKQRAGADIMETKCK